MLGTELAGWMEVKEACTSVVDKDANKRSSPAPLDLFKPSRRVYFPMALFITGAGGTAILFALLDSEKGISAAC